MEEFTTGILVKRDGLYRRSWYGGQHEERIDSFFPFLNEPLQVENDITFEDFFNHVMNEHELVNVIFASQLGGFDLGEWREEWKKPFVDKPDEHTRTKYLGVEWVAEWNNYGSKREIEEYVGFGGHGETLHEDKWVDGMNISFSFTPINGMKGYLFKIDTEYKMFDSAIKKVKKEEDWFVVVGVKGMTVYDVIGGILNDISFYGEPDSRDKQCDELDKRCKETKDVIDKKGLDGAIKDGDLFEWDLEGDNE